MIYSCVSGNCALRIAHYALCIVHCAFCIMHCALILVEQRFFYGVAWTMFYLDEDFTDVFADYADGNEDEAAEKPY